MKNYDRDRAAAFMVTACRDWSLGYGQGSGTGGRLDIRDGGAADCSSLVSAAGNIGYGGTASTWSPLASDTYTGNLRARLVTLGWEARAISGATTASLGQVLLYEGHHTAMCVAGDGTLAEAWINELGQIVGGTAGDQTGGETRLINANAHPYRARWDWILTPPTTITTTVASTATTVDATTPQEIDMILIQTPTYGLGLLTDRIIPFGDQATIDALQGAGIPRATITDADWKRLATAGTAQIVAYNSRFGMGLLAGGRLTPLASQATVDALKSQGAPQVTLTDTEWTNLTKEK